MTKQSILQYLEDIGWTDLIDSRFKDQLIRDIKIEFPDISDELLSEILNLVLV